MPQARNGLFIEVIALFFPGILLRLVARFAAGIQSGPDHFAGPLLHERIRLVGLRFAQTSRLLGHGAKKIPSCLGFVCEAGNFRQDAQHIRISALQIQ